MTVSAVELSVNRFFVRGNVNEPNLLDSDSFTFSVEEASVDSA